MLLQMTQLFYYFCLVIACLQVIVMKWVLQQGLVLACDVLFYLKNVVGATLANLTTKNVYWVN